ncbi:MAG: hypothetical protein ACYTFW_00395 [Planctomycetota bacterium]|jgi:hypothetical protein
MVIGPVWELNNVNTITFVLVDNTNTEVTGLGSGFTLEISKNGGAFAGSAGTKSEIGNGWYKYVATAAEADTVGVVSIKITHASIVQQNLEYVVEQRTAGAVYYTYTVKNTVTLNPIDGVEVWVTTDVAGNNIVWNGNTDAFGVARDVNDARPLLDPGTYYFWSKKAGYNFPNPDTEVVS